MFKKNELRIYVVYTAEICKPANFLMLRLLTEPSEHKVYQNRSLRVPSY